MSVRRRDVGRDAAGSTLRVEVLVSPAYSPSLTLAEYPHHLSTDHPQPRFGWTFNGRDPGMATVAVASTAV